MKKNIQFFLAGVLITVMVFNGAVYAKSLMEKIEVRYDNIKVYKDSVLQNLKDAQGNIIEPFIYQGTTYVPVRAASELAGMKVQWDGATKSIYLWDKVQEGTKFLMDIRPPHTGTNHKIYNDRNKLQMGGKEYSKAIELNTYYYSKAQTFFNLDGEFSEIEMLVGTLNSEKVTPSDFEVYLDDQLVKKIEFKKGDVPQKVKIPVKGALKLELRADREKYSTYYGQGFSIGIAEIIVK